MVLFVFITVFLDLVGFGIVIPLLPFYVKSMGGTPETVGVILACFSFTQLVTTPILGRLSDRFGRRPVILVSLLGNAAAMVVFALATRLSLLPLLFISRIIAGATAGNLSACQAAIADVSKGTERAQGMGRIGAGIGLGLMLGPVIGGVLSKIGPWAPPLGAAAMALADLAGAFFFMPETRVRRDAEPAADKPKPTLGQVLSQRKLLIVLALYFLTFLAMTNLQTALALLVHARFDWGETEVGLLFGLVGFIGLVIQGGLIGRLARAYASLDLIVAGAALLCGGMLLLAAGARPAAAVGGLALVGIGLGLTNPLLSTTASELAGSEQQGAVLGFAQSSGGLARTIGPIWAGFLFGRVGTGAPFFSGATAAALSVVLGLALRGHRTAKDVSEKVP